MTTTAQGIPTSTERLAAGKVLRDGVPRSSHSAWEPPADRIDPLRIIAAAERGRVARLIPLRNARIAESPFAFYRGTAAVMAADLATTPVTGLRVQLCGDAHCLNFGAYATPERRLIFDVNDFDETLTGPWEWDVKRLAASLVLAARSIKLKDVSANIAALNAVRSYRLKMLEFAGATALDTWYTRIDAADLAAPADADERRKRKQIIEGAQTHSMKAAVAKYTVAGVGGRRLLEDPPLMYHPLDSSDGEFDIERVFATYALTLRPDVRVLFGRYRLIDHAVKVVGVGSVGTRCTVALLAADRDDTLILQIKQAEASVLEPYVGSSPFDNHGERVVYGQRLMQSASDVFLGWGTSGDHDFYVRQFRDKKGSVNIAAMDGYGLREYARMCGWALANAHARSGDAAQIAGYLGRNDAFDKALVRFGLLYANQAEADYEEFLAAIDAGKIAVAKTPVTESLRPVHNSASPGR
jgi:uncharacterized protein (DUF2252 family)